MKISNISLLTYCIGIHLKNTCAMFQYFPLFCSDGNKTPSKLIIHAQSNNRNTRKRFDLRSIKKPERSHLRHLPLLLSINR